MKQLLEVQGEEEFPKTIDLTVKSVKPIDSVKVSLTVKDIDESRKEKSLLVEG